MKDFLKTYKYYNIKNQKIENLRRIIYLPIYSKN